MNWPALFFLAICQARPDLVKTPPAAMLLCWGALFSRVTSVYCVLVKEPGLENRFSNETPDQKALCSAMGTQTAALRATIRGLTGPVGCRNEKTLPDGQGH